MKIINAKRFDYGELREVTRTPQGFLFVPGIATRTGVFPYVDGEGKIRRELRHPDDVMAPESLVTLKYAPITIEHPPEMVDPSNVDEYGVGHLTERVEVNRDMIETDFIIEDQEGIDAVERDGIRETSCGYSADIIAEEGVYNGVPYNARQKNIRYNHVALVKRGRAGPEVRLRLDSADAVMQDADPKAGEFSQESGVNDSADAETKTIVVGGKEWKLPAELADIVQDYTDRFDEMRAKQAQLEESMKVQRKDKNDVDVSQPGVSPQVKVEQQGKDGRDASGKVAPSSKSDEDMGDEDEEKKDADEKEQAKKDAEADEKKDAEEQAKKDAEEDKKKLDADPEFSKLKKDADEAKKKMDAYANAAFGKGEKKDAEEKGEKGEKMDSADIQAKIRGRVKLEREAEKHVPFEVAKKFDSMSDDEVRCAVIKHLRPSAELKGKTSSYLEHRFDSIIESIEDETSSDRKSAGRAMLEIGGSRNDSASGEAANPEAARLKMISESRKMHTMPLSASKK